MCTTALRVGGEFKENTTENDELSNSGVSPASESHFSQKLAEAVKRRGGCFIKYKPESSKYYILRLLLLYLTFKGTMVCLRAFGPAEIKSSLCFGILRFWVCVSANPAGFDLSRS